MVKRRGTLVRADTRAFVGFEIILQCFTFCLLKQFDVLTAELNTTQTVCRTKDKISMFFVSL